MQPVTPEQARETLRRRDLWKQKAALHRQRADEMRVEAAKLTSLAVAEEELVELADGQVPDAVKFSKP